MENRLRSMFDFQRFANDPRLNRMLDDALGRYDLPGEGELSDDDAEQISAAGSLVADPDRGKEKHPWQQ